MRDTLTITMPDDWHLHLRRGAMMRRVVRDTAAQFARAVVMPNLLPPIVTVEAALAYRAEIISALPSGINFQPLMSLYLTDDTPAAEVKKVAAHAETIAFKLYPAGATTNSADGVTRVSNIMPVLEAMAECGVVLQVHGEVTDADVDVFDREAVFIEQVLAPLHRELPALKIVLEHITTEHGVQFVQDAGDNVAATMTVHHLMFNRNEIFRDGIRPHAYCLPVLKREHHRRALLAAAIGGTAKFFLGTDSAPHTRTDKESACGCAGIYSAHAAMELYAEVFDRANALDKLEGFAAHHGADFYGLPRNATRLTLQRKSRTVACAIEVDGGEIIPLRAGGEVGWVVA